MNVGEALESMPAAAGIDESPGGLLEQPICGLYQRSSGRGGRSRLLRLGDKTLADLHRMV
jgi:hypothetical protein